MKKQKLLFFDIDGTLLPFYGKVPESTIRALKKVQQQGHQIFLCSGRSERMIPQELIDLGFDGIVSATGATIRYHGQLVYTKCIGNAVSKLISVMEEAQAMYSLQSTEISFSPYRMEEWVKTRRRSPFPSIYADLSCQSEQYGVAEKAIYFFSSIPNTELAARLAPEFEVTASSVDPSDQHSGEITMAGVNKSSAMAWLGNYLGVPREDMIAFGDGPNDLDMLSYAGIGVAMGNAVPGAKAAADYITDDVTEDGISHAIDHLIKE